MRALLYANLTNRLIYADKDGASFSWPALVQGDTAVLGFRLLERRENKLAPSKRTLQGLKAAIGRRDARPARGSIRFQIGNPATTPTEGANLTTALPFNFTAGELQEALNALSAKPAAASVTEDEGSFLIVWAGQTAHTTLTPRSNRLSPISVVDPLQYVRDGDYLTEIRLKQAPVAFADAYEAVLPPPPEITESLAGGSNGDVEWDEVQKLYIPPTFEGAFILTRGFRKTANGPDEADGYITIDDTAETIAEKINKTLVDTGEVFVVAELAGQNAFTIRFSGDMSGTDHPLLGLTVIEAPPGDPTLQLKLDRPEMAAVLRGAKNGEVKLPIEIEFSLENEADDSQTDVITLVGEVTIKAEITLDSAAQAQNIDWLREPSPVSYRPRGAGQIANGVLYWSEPRGNGAATSFAIDHNLATDIALPMVRRNVTAGEQLIHGVDYNVVFTNNNTLTINALGDWITTPPDTDEWLVSVLGMAQASQYAPHTHSIDEVDDLRSELDALAAAVAEIQTLVPLGQLAASSTETGQKVIAEWTLARMLELYPSRDWALPVSPGSTNTTTTSTQSTATATTTKETKTSSDTATLEVGRLIDLPPAALPKDGGLLPALHDADPQPVTALPAVGSGQKGKVVVNSDPSQSILIPGGRGRRSVYIAPGEFAGCDGALWFKVAKADAAKQTFYPTDFERELFLIAVNDQQLRLKKTFELNLGFEVALVTTRLAGGWEYLNKGKNTRAQWQIVIEHGTFGQETSPGPGLSAAFSTSDIFTLTSGDPPGFDYLPLNSKLRVGTTGTRPAPLQADTDYYLKEYAGGSGKLSATPGGAAIDITGTGTGTHYLIPQIAFDVNLKDITWNATPLLKHTFFITREGSIHTFGCRIARSLVDSVDTITAEKILYGAASVGDSAPASANFALRARLTRFDIEDTVAEPRALVALLGLNLEPGKGASESTTTNMGYAQIK